MLKFPSSLSQSFTRAILSFVISSLIVCIYLPSGYSLYTPVIFQNCLAQVNPASPPLLIAKADGTLPAYIESDYSQGIGNETDGNYILGCDAAQKKLSPGDFYLKVNAGEFNDYIIPYDPYTKGGVAASLCDALKKYDQNTLVSYYLYSSIKPDDEKFNGAKVVLKWAGSTTPYLGGCNVYVSDDARYTITRWGLYERDESKKGSCCFSSTAEIDTKPFGGWGIPFTITAHKFSAKYVFMSKGVFSRYGGSTKYALYGKVNDIYLNPKGAFKCAWTITPNYADKTVKSAPFTYNECEFDANITLLSEPSNATFSCSISSDTGVTFWPPSTGKNKAIIVPLGTIPLDTTTTIPATSSNVPKGFHLNYYYCLSDKNYGIFLIFILLSLLFPMLRV